MGRENRGECFRSSPRLVKLDLVAHGVALVSCTTGGIVLESVVLMGAASHHVASIGFRLNSEEMTDELNRSRARGAMFSAVQLILWACCVVLTIVVTAQGAHEDFRLARYFGSGHRAEGPRPHRDGGGGKALRQIGVLIRSGGGLALDSSLALRHEVDESVLEVLG